MVGIESSSVPQDFWRNISTECPACLSWPLTSWSAPAASWALVGMTRDVGARRRSVLDIRMGTGCPGFRYSCAVFVRLVMGWVRHASPRFSAPRRRHQRRDDQRKEYIIDLASGERAPAFNPPVQHQNEGRNDVLDS